MQYIKGLRIDWERGEGEVRLPEEFLRADPVLKADILGDWLGELTRAYNEALAEMRGEGGVSHVGRAVA